MRFLITELLDFRKQEQGYMRLKVENANLVAFVREIYMSFYEYAQKRKIVYEFQYSEESLEVWFDPVQLQKVVFNLLSNAFKYTPEKGEIVVAVKKRSKRQVEITVKDTGKGIPENLIHKIFERFYQVGASGTEVTLGTGIGLALSKGIVELHKGEIKVESAEGAGSTFTVLLLEGNAHFSPEELNHLPVGSAVLDNKDQGQLMKDQEQLMHLGPDKEPEETGGEETDRTTSEEKPTILIVEDNAEVMEMLEDIFTPIYNVYKAVDGNEGFEMTRMLQPDLVLSDVMMPHMSGKEMCYKIKNSFDVSHIPVVLLTAQSSVDQTIEGYIFGADDYIAKPFNVKLLVYRCNNLVKNRRRLLEKIKENKTQVASVSTTNAHDRELIDRAVKVIVGNFENPEFDMSMLAAELGLGRTKLFTHFKELVGITPNEFALKLKLEESVRMLKENPEDNISEISYKLGFSSPRYFSRCFKTFYGVTPKEYRNIPE